MFYFFVIELAKEGALGVDKYEVGGEGGRCF